MNDTDKKLMFVIDVFPKNNDINIDITYCNVKNYNTEKKVNFMDSRTVQIIPLLKSIMEIIENNTINYESNGRIILGKVTDKNSLKMVIKNEFNNEELK